MILEAQRVQAAQLVSTNIRGILAFRVRFFFSRKIKTNGLFLSSDSTLSRFAINYCEEKIISKNHEAKKSTVTGLIRDLIVRMIFDIAQQHANPFIAQQAQNSDRGSYEHNVKKVPLRISNQLSHVLFETRQPKVPHASVLIGWNSIEFHVNILCQNVWKYES